jgi:hypothetical protein
VTDHIATWEVQFYPANSCWCVSDGPLEVLSAHTIASFDTEEDAQRFADARNAWERNKKPPRPEDFNGERDFGRYCRAPGCGNHVNVHNFMCGDHGGAKT